MQELQPIIWMRAPNGVTALINPIFWIQVSEFFSRSNFDVLRWIADKNYHPIIKTPPVLDAVKAAIPGRGYNYLVKNFRWIIETLMELKIYRTPPKRKIAADILAMMDAYPDCLFPQYLPLPNKAMLVIENSNVGTYLDTTVSGAVDAIRTMTGIDLPENNFTLSVKENRTIKTLCQLSDFYIDWYSKSMVGKPGVLRKHVYGSRADFSCRAVISSVSDKHEYDEISVSWGIAVSMLRIHTCNKLRRMGYTPNESFGFLDDHAHRFHPILAKIFDELMTECPYRGIPVILGRNPSLMRGSTQQVFISKIHHDVHIPTIGLSVLVLRNLNADFDGDNVNVSMSLDHRTTRDQRTLAPHMSVIDMDKPRSISSAQALPKPVASTIAEWLHGDEPPLTAQEQRQMEALFNAV